MNKNSFINQFAENIKFHYTSFDRVIIRGYILNFFSLACVVRFLKAMGFSRQTNGVMRIFTDQLNAHISKQAEKFGVYIHWWPSMGGGVNGAKLQFVENQYARRFNGQGDHLFCIITDKENVRTVAAREFTTKKGRKHQVLYKCNKPVKQYYIYFHDSVLGGPCYLKISSYLPFPCEFYFNGHNYIKLQLDKKGCSYKMKENAITDAFDPDAVNQAATEIDGKMIQQRIDFWMNRFFKFDKGKYSTRSKHLKHDWYLTQVEVCSNVIFKSARYCTSLFERLLDKFSRVGLPDTIARIFSRRPARSSSKSFWRLYDNNACIKHWFRGNAIKQYNKTGYYIRTETTINNPKSLGLKKPVLFLQACLWTGLGCNDRLFDCCADVDLSTIYDGEADLFDQPVLDHKDKKVTPPDLRKERQLVLCKELLKPKYTVNGFKTAELQRSMRDLFSNSAQIRYEMRKLIVRGAIIKQKNKSFYRVTEKGWKWLWASITSKRYFRNPVISAAFKTRASNTPTQSHILEEGLGLVNQGLSQITQGLAINV